MRRRELRFFVRRRVRWIRDENGQLVKFHSARVVKFQQTFLIGAYRRKHLFELIEELTPPFA